MLRDVALVVAVAGVGEGGVGEQEDDSRRGHAVAVGHRWVSAIDIDGVAGPDLDPDAEACAALSSAHIASADLRAISSGVTGSSFPRRGNRRALFEERRARPR